MFRGSAHVESSEAPATRPSDHPHLQPLVGRHGRTRHAQTLAQEGKLDSDSEHGNRATPSDFVPGVFPVASQIRYLAPI